MKFIADNMLGKLAKWMRVMGCDVEYYRDIEDGELIERALREGRVLLTRDTLLLRRRKAKGNSFFVQGNDFRDQLRQVIRHFSIDPFKGFLTRCVECNIILENIEKTKAIEKVPEYVYQTQDSFAICPKCHKIYWGATHKEEMVREIEDIFKG